MRITKVNKGTEGKGVVGKFVILMFSLLVVNGAFVFASEGPDGNVVVNNSTPFYLIGPGDDLNIFVWRNPDLSLSVPVRPDGRISIPLVEDLEVSKKTPSEIARTIEKRLGVYVKDPIVTVIITRFNGPFNQQIRVVGEAAQPQALAYREEMTVLDVMILAGGLTEFAAGNRAIIVRSYLGEEVELKVRLEDLIKDGDISANIPVLPGDILIIPESWF